MTELRAEVDDVYSVGHYRKSFDFQAEWSGKWIFLEFEGIYRDATFWVNGVYMDRHLSGYTGFLLEITEETSYVLSRGGTVNDLGSGRIDSSGNVTMSWGSTPKGFVKHVEQRPWYAGGFMWTGFDYRVGSRHARARRRKGRRHCDL